MTLILTAATPLYVVQCADRLLTMTGRVGMRAADSAANKTLIYRAADAVAVISYAGLAYAGAMQTDEYLAQILWGAPLGRGPDGVRPANRIGPRPHRWNMGQAERALEAALADQGFDGHAVACTIAGWRTRKGRVYPFVTEIERDAHASAPIVSRAPRRFTPTQNFFLHGIGVPVEGEEIMCGLGRAHEGKHIGPTAAQTEQALAQAIHAAAARDGRVGDDVLSVVLPRPGAGAGVVTFHAARAWPAEIVTPTRRLAVAPAAHTPWLITSNMIVPPSALVGEAGYDLGGYEIVIRGARGERGVLGLQTSLARPSLAALRERYKQEGQGAAPRAVTDPAPSNASSLRVSMDGYLEGNHAPEALHARGDCREAAAS